MSTADLLKEAKHLSVSERLDLIDQLIDSVEVDAPAKLSARVESELDRRHRGFLANPNEGEPWEVVRERIQRGLDATKDNRPA
ncbi:MAG TPA: addiction module protein [Tepidisphaeraceae bacterium]|jgi:putative addiction module component (TIGR02574 family)|nr:addiction module protein [Tepidisphaeraceae bacterium]